MFIDDTWQLTFRSARATWFRKVRNMTHYSWHLTSDKLINVFHPLGYVIFESAKVAQPPKFFNYKIIISTSLDLVGSKFRKTHLGVADRLPEGYVLGLPNCSLIWPPRETFSFGSLIFGGHESVFYEEVRTRNGWRVVFLSLFEVSRYFFNRPGVVTRSLHVSFVLSRDLWYTGGFLG